MLCWCIDWLIYSFVRSFKPIVRSKVGRISDFGALGSTARTRLADNRCIITTVKCFDLTFKADGGLTIIIEHYYCLFCIALNCFPLLIQQNVDGSNAFNRSWEEYKVGFNDSRGNFWLGNDLLHQLTKTDRYKLRFDLQERSNGSWYYAEYSSFIVHNEISNYRMQVSGYSGNAGDAGRGFMYHDGMMFTTYNRDNDQSSRKNCAVFYGGGFWHYDCANTRVNVIRGRGHDFAWFGSGRRILLQTSRMWLTC